jgi:hypothetical protein
MKVSTPCATASHLLTARTYFEVQGSGVPLVFVHAGVTDHRLWQDQPIAFNAVLHEFLSRIT